jgi:hypothetical protein
MKQSESLTHSTAESQTAAGGHTALPNALPAHNYPPARGTATEARVHPSQKPYSINELDILHGLSRRTVTRIYERERGILIHQASLEHQQKVGWG